MEKALIAAGVIVALLVITYVLLEYTPLPIIVQQNPGHFHRKAYEGIVERIRAARIGPNQEREFYLDNVIDPGTLHMLDRTVHNLQGNGTGHGWAAVSPEGKLKVVIETRDLGHAGEYGFAYSDTPLTPTPMASETRWQWLDVPGRLTQMLPGMQIDDHWWVVENVLD